jgi:hypothetical protein
MTPSCQPGRPHQERAAKTPESIHRPLFDTGWGGLVAHEICRSPSPAVRSQKVVTISGCARSFILGGDGQSRREISICMSAFFGHGVAAIWGWWHRTFQSAESSAIAGPTAFGKENLSWFFSAALSAPAPMIPRPIMRTIASIGTGADMANKWKPSIVRVIRIRRRRPACESRFPGEFGGRKTVNG